MLRPHAVIVKPKEDYCLFIEFSNGEKRLFDVKPYLKGEWFSELKRPEVFEQVKVEGVSICWPGGQDICPDELYYGSMPCDTKPPSLTVQSSPERIRHTAV